MEASTQEFSPVRASVPDASSRDIALARDDFPIFASTRPHGHQLVYLDSAASAQKPQAVLDSLANTYENAYANVHRGMHHLSNLATAAYEDSRKTLCGFLNARHIDEIIFTGGSTDSLNLVASSFAEPMLQEGDEIALTVFEHHSNIVPWHFLRERKGVQLRWIECNKDGSFDINSLEKALTPRVKLLAVTHMSNATGVILPIKDIIKRAHERGIITVVDGSQAAVHMPVDVRDIDCDFYAVTGHKLYAPSGIGALYAKREHLQAMRPYRGGGEMIREVARDNITYADSPHRFEAGTPPIAQAIAFGSALEYIQSWNWRQIQAHEAALRQHAIEQLGKINGVNLVGVTDAGGSIVSFTVDNGHAHDIATIIDQYGVAVRAGHHCAQPLMEHFGVSATARASFAIYNTHEDVETLASALKRAIKLLD